jgi:uncharacterized protein (DUF697 family)
MSDNNAGINKVGETIIRKHMMYAMAGAAVPVPLVDLTAVTAIQLDMLKQLAHAHGVTFHAGSSKAFVTSVSATLASNMAARLGASVIKLIPFVGPLVGGAAQALFTGASTYALGRFVNDRFATGHDLDSLDMDKVKQELHKHYQHGRELAEKWRQPNSQTQDESTDNQEK